MRPFRAYAAAARFSDNTWASALMGMTGFRLDICMLCTATGWDPIGSYILTAVV